MIAWWSFRWVRSAWFPIWRWKALGWRGSTRQRCCGPDSRRRQAGANFRTALWRVRGQAGDGVVRTEPGRLALANTVAVDVQDVAKEARALIGAPAGA